MVARWDGWGEAGTPERSRGKLRGWRRIGRLLPTGIDGLTSVEEAVRVCLVISESSRKSATIAGRCGPKDNWVTAPGREPGKYLIEEWPSER